jgi:hypothetical protein
LCPLTNIHAVFDSFGSTETGGCFRHTEAEYKRPAKANIAAADATQGPTKVSMQYTSLSVVTYSSKKPSVTIVAIVVVVPKVLLHAEKSTMSSSFGIFLMGVLMKLAVSFPLSSS